MNWCLEAHARGGQARGGVYAHARPHAHLPDVPDVLDRICTARRASDVAPVWTVAPSGARLQFLFVSITDEVRA